MNSRVARRTSRASAHERPAPFLGCHNHHPAGALSDQIGRGGLLAIGIACLIVADLFLVVCTTTALVMIGIVFWGPHMAFTQGLFASLVADTVPESLHETAFGVFSFGGGIAMLASLADSGGPRLVDIAKPAPANRARLSRRQGG